MRGPVVYCAEEADNGSDMHLFKLIPGEPAKEGTVTIEGQEFPTVIVKAKKQVKEAPFVNLYQEYKKERYEETRLTLVPYYAWANRGENEMMVWMRK